MAITTLKSLKQHLQCAIEVEHSTIPPYLCALYSLEEESSPAYRAILGVVLEEMLHAVLVCNLLNAVGGVPRFDDPDFIPRYPGPLPHHEPDPPLVLHLERCSVELVRDTFLRIEQPEPRGAPPEEDNYTSLGQFYHAVELGLERLAEDVGEAELFCGDPDRQVRSGYWGSGGELVVVDDLPSAKRAIEEIIEQGEGSPRDPHDADGELAHYWKFKAIVDDPGSIGKVYPMASDPSTAGIPAGPVRELSKLFNDCYGLLLRKLTDVVGGKSYQVLTTVQLMKNILKPIAVLLMQTPIDADDPTRGHAGPSFEYSEVETPQVIDRCQRLETTYPQLAAVTRTLQNLRLYDQG